MHCAPWGLSPPSPKPRSHQHGLRLASRWYELAVRLRRGGKAVPSSEKINPAWTSTAPARSALYGAVLGQDGGSKPQACSTTDAAGIVVREAFGDCNGLRSSPGAPLLVMMSATKRTRPWALVLTTASNGQGSCSRSIYASPRWPHPLFLGNPTCLPEAVAATWRQKWTWRSSARGRGLETGGNRFFRETVRRRPFARFQSRGVDGWEQKQRRVHFSLSAPPCSNRSRETNGRLPGGLPDRVGPLFPVRAPPCPRRKTSGVSRGERLPASPGALAR